MVDDWYVRAAQSHSQGSSNNVCAGARPSHSQGSSNNVCAGARPSAAHDNPSGHRASMSHVTFGHDSSLEQKGAMRELRKDASFLARHRQEEEDKTQKYLEDRGKRAMGIMQDQEANWKSMKREKKTGKVKPGGKPSTLGALI